MSPDILTVAEAARLVGCHPTTLKRWATAGHLTGWQTPGGHWRFDRQEVVRYIEGTRPDDRL